MGLRQRFTEAMKAALKAGEKKRLSAVRLMLAAVQERDNAAPAGTSGISDDEILTLLAKMIKQREESAATYESVKRPELAAIEREEIAVIREFMPRQLDASETETAVKEAITAAGATGIKDMGKVMAALKERYAGQMDFAKASAMTKDLLSVPK